MPFPFFKKSKEKKLAQAPISQELPLRTPRKLRKASIRSSNAPTTPQRPVFIPPLHEHHSPPIRVAPMQYPDEELPLPQLHGVPFHSSIPRHDGSVDGWRAFPPPYRTDTLLVRGQPHPRVSGASAMPPDNPEVSRYYSMAHELEHPQPKPIEPQPPSRTWSPIPSVLRESSSQIGRKGSVRERSVNGSDDSWGEGGMTTTSMQGRSTPFKQAGDLRHSTQTIGEKQSGEKMRYVEYKAPGTPKIHEPNGLGLMQPQPMHPPRENLARRTPSPEIIEAKVVERPISWVEKDDDPEMEADVYHYIVPAGLSVVFQDEAGTKITRVGKVVQTLHEGRPLKSKPIIVHDTSGRELYRDEMPAPTTPKTIHGRIKGKSREVPESADPPKHPPWATTSPGSKTSTLSSKTFLIDEKGNLIPM